jgi:hypothetical protein
MKSLINLSFILDSGASVFDNAETRVPPAQTEDYMPRNFADLDVLESLRESGDGGV